MKRLIADANNGVMWVDSFKGFDEGPEIMDEEEFLYWLDDPDIGFIGAEVSDDVFIRIRNIYGISDRRVSKKFSVWDLPCAEYAADCGSIMVGNGEFFAHYSNGIGDTSGSKIFMMKGFEKEDAQKIILEKLSLIEIVEGNGAVYDYDIPGKAEPIFKLNGRYFLYHVMHDGRPTGNILIQDISK